MSLIQGYLLTVMVVLWGNSQGEKDGPKDAPLLPSGEISWLSDRTRELEPSVQLPMPPTATRGRKRHRKTGHPPIMTELLPLDVSTRMFETKPSERHSGARANPAHARQKRSTEDETEKIRCFFVTVTLPTVTSVRSTSHITNRKSEPHVLNSEVIVPVPTTEPSQSTTLSESSTLDLIVSTAVVQPTTTDQGFDILAKESGILDLNVSPSLSSEFVGAETASIEQILPSVQRHHRSVAVLATHVELTTHVVSVESPLLSSAMKSLSEQPSDKPVSIEPTATLDISRTVSEFGKVESLLTTLAVMPVVSSSLIDSTVLLPEIKPSRTVLASQSSATLSAVVHSTPGYALPEVARNVTPTRASVELSITRSGRDTTPPSSVNRTSPIKLISPTAGSFRVPSSLPSTASSQASQILKNPPSPNPNPPSPNPNPPSPNPNPPSHSLPTMPSSTAAPNCSKSVKGATMTTPKTDTSQPTSAAMQQDLRNCTDVNYVTTYGGYFTNSGDTLLSLPALIGIVIGAASFLFILCAIVFLVYHKRKSKKASPYLRKPKEHYTGLFDDSSITLSYISINTDIVKDPPEEMISLDNDSFLNSLESMIYTNQWANTAKPSTKF